MLHRLLLGLLAGGHVLLEGVPGLAKTLVIKTLADALDGTFSRIQFTPDMLPGDVVGTQIYNPREGTLHGQEGAGVRQLHPRRRDQPRARQGPVRAARGDAGAPGHARRPDVPARPSRSSCSRRRTRSSRRAPIRCPRRSSTASCSRSRSAIRRKDDEVKIIDRMAGSGAEPTASKVMGTDEILAARDVVQQVFVDDKVKRYAVDLVAATRDPKAAGLPQLAPLIDNGASPRASIALIKVAKAQALLVGPQLHLAARREDDRARRAAPPHPRQLRGRGAGQDHRSRDRADPRERPGPVRSPDAARRKSRKRSSASSSSPVVTSRT